ncbi:MAG: nuclear transport factor 2 family protein [Bryobacteraceae bacterium]
MIHIEREMDDAAVKGDTSASENHLADNSIFTDPGGKVMDKAQSIADFESSKLDDMKVHVYGNSAVVTYGTTDRGTYKGKDISGKYRWTDVFVKRNAR